MVSLQNTYDMLDVRLYGCIIDNFRLFKDLADTVFFFIFMYKISLQIEKHED